MVEHFYPEIGEYNKGAVEVIKKLKNAGHKIILNTARVEFENGTFEKAVDFLNLLIGENFFSFDNSAKSKITPCNWDWNLFFAYNAIYIDDLSQSIPSKPNIKLPDRSMVDWVIIDQQFAKNGIY